MIVDDPNHEGMRTDRYVSEVLGLFSRSQIPLRDLRVETGGAPSKLSRRVHLGDRLQIHYSEPRPTTVQPEPMQLSILYEDDRVIVVDKPAGTVVHPAKGNYSGTLVQGLMHHIQSLSTRFGDSVRPGVVHRLDKDTSGVIIAAKDPEAQRYLADQFKRRATDKRYLAIAKGRVAAGRGHIEGFIARDPHHRKRFRLSKERGKPSATEYRVLARFDGYTFLSLQPETGRTHQLRVHLAHLGHPILGDPVYSRRDQLFPESGLMLHAYRLRIALPPDDTEHCFRAPLPDRFKRILAQLSKPARGSSPGATRG